MLDRFTAKLGNVGTMTNAPQRRFSYPLSVHEYMRSLVNITTVEVCGEVHVGFCG